MAQAKGKKRWSVTSITGENDVSKIFIIYYISTVGCLTGSGTISIHAETASKFWSTLKAERVNIE